jgi:hypothetical protein
VHPSAATCPSALNLALLAEVSSGAGTCPRAPGSIFLRGHGPRWLSTIGIKKYLAALGMQLGSCVFKAHSCVTETPVDVHAAIVHPYSAALVQLASPKHGYSGNMT